MYRDRILNFSLETPPNGKVLPSFIHTSEHIENNMLTTATICYGIYAYIKLGYM